MATNDNIKSHLVRVYLSEDVSKKTGNPFYQLTTIWHRPGKSDYKSTVFLTAEQYALIEDSAPIEASL